MVFPLALAFRVHQYPARPEGARRWRGKTFRTRGLSGNCAAELDHEPRRLLLFPPRALAGCRIRRMFGLALGNSGGAVGSRPGHASPFDGRCPAEAERK